MSHRRGLMLIAVSVLWCGALAWAQTATPSAQQNSFFAGPGTRGAFLNGAPLLPGTSILAGETVTTGPGGVAVLAPTHGAGGVLEMGPGAQATVAAGNYNPAVGSDQLDLHQGSALVTGSVAVGTSQGLTFQPQTSRTSFIVDASGTHSTMGVLSGAVRTYSPVTTPSVIPAGNAIQVTGTGGNTQLTRVSLQSVQRPSTSAAQPQTTPASQSQ